MKKQKQIVSEDNLTISRSHTHSSTAEGENTAQIPVDLLIDTFLRVPSRSIARFRCVSKSWASILSRPYFTELFLTKSLNHPRLLFIARHGGKLFFFSSAQTHNPDNANLSFVAKCYRTHSLDCKRVSLLHGMVYCQDRYSENTTPVICNPFTGESLKLPKEKSVLFSPSNYFGYDPIDKQYKVLYVTSSPTSKTSLAQVLTLETGKRLWRRIECKPHYPMPSTTVICIDGVLYYCASCDLELMDSIVCFDVRSEKFSFINIEDKSMIRACVFINYKGKLGGVHFITGTYKTRLRLWLLEVDDAGKNKWSSNILELPPSWKFPYNYQLNFDIVGMTSTGDIVLSPDFYADPFHVLYYNIERKTVARVEIQGLKEFKYRGKLYTFQDYVEDVKLMKSL